MMRGQIKWGVIAMLVLALSVCNNSPDNGLSNENETNDALQPNSVTHELEIRQVEADLWKVFKVGTESTRVVVHRGDKIVWNLPPSPVEFQFPKSCRAYFVQCPVGLEGEEEFFNVDGTTDTTFSLTVQDRHFANPITIVTYFVHIKNANETVQGDTPPEIIIEEEDY